MKTNTVTINGVNFNADHANKVSKDQFIKDHEPHGSKDLDLGEAWESMQTDKPKTKVKADSK